MLSGKISVLRNNWPIILEVTVYKDPVASQIENIESLNLNLET